MGRVVDFPTEVPDMSAKPKAAAAAAAAPGSKKRKQRPSNVVSTEEAVLAPPAAVAPADGVPRLGAREAAVPYTNKQRVLVFSTRGITARYRHLMDDIRKLLPHHKKDVKVRCAPPTCWLCVALRDARGFSCAAGLQGLLVCDQRNS
jgi:hypothetical protein